MEEINFTTTVQLRDKSPHYNNNNNNNNTLFRF